jgi:hypothetical protein
MAPLPPQYKIEPMDLANMRHNGVRSLAVACFGCRHEVVVNVDSYPGDLLVKDFGPRMVWHGRRRRQAKPEERAR